MAKIEGSGTARAGIAIRAMRAKCPMSNREMWKVGFGGLTGALIAACAIAFVDCNQEDAFPRIEETGWAPLGVQLDGAARLGCWDYNEDQTAGTMRVMCVLDGASIPCASGLKAAPLRITIGCE